MIVEIFIFIVLLTLLWFTTKKPSSMPPGSYGLPFFGHLPSRKIPVTEHFRQLQQIYGNIFTTKWGIHPVVVMTDFSIIKKAFQHPDLQGRPQFQSFSILHPDTSFGVVVNEGQTWAENRRFVLRHLRDLGMGKTVLEGSVQDEAALLVDYLEKNCAGKPAVMDLAINGAVVNVLWQMLASKRYNIDDPESTYYSYHAEAMLEFNATKMFLCDIFPILHTILPEFLMNKFFEKDKAYEHSAVLSEMSISIIKTHMQTLDPDNPRDLVDQFILQYGKQGSGYALNDSQVENLSCIMTDLFIAGSETTGATLRWMILYMAVHPEIQAKVQKCLDEVVPPGRLPGLGDRSQLPYVDAMLLETLRLSSFTPFGLMHRATADVPLEGYVIPKDTIVVGCLKLCHHNESAWEKASEFDPGHFLDENGQLNGKKDNFLPFSIGRRLCIGESLARTELFLFGAAILQRFTIEPPPGVTLSLEVNPLQVITTHPLPYKVVLRKRN